MLRCSKFLIGIICLLIFGFTISPYAEEEIEDLIDIAESKGKIIAIIEGGKTITFDLRPDEKVLWSGSRGYLGAVLTDQHLLVTKNRAVGFDATSNRFVETLLPIHDELLAAEVERYVAVVITSSRAFGLAAESSAFTQIILGIRETIEDIKLTSSKATVRTSDRLLTFETSSSTWKEHRF